MDHSRLPRAFYQKERGPEDEISRGDDHVHLDSGNALGLQMSDVLLYLDTLWWSDGEKVLTVLTGEVNGIESPVSKRTNNKSLCVRMQICQLDFSFREFLKINTNDRPLFPTCFSVLTAIENNL